MRSDTLKEISSPLYCESATSITSKNLNNNLIGQTELNWYEKIYPENSALPLDNSVCVSIAISLPLSRKTFSRTTILARVCIHEGSGNHSEMHDIGKNRTLNSYFETSFTPIRWGIREVKTLSLKVLLKCRKVLLKKIFLSSKRT